MVLHGTVGLLSIHPSIQSLNRFVLFTYSCLYIESCRGHQNLELTSLFVSWFCRPFLFCSQLKRFCLFFMWILAAMRVHRRRNRE